MAVKFVVQGSSPNVFDGQTVPESKTFAECATLEEARAVKKQHELLQSGYLDADERWNVIVLEETREGERVTYRLMED